MSFSKLGLPGSLLDALADQKYVRPYPIQEAAIPAILDQKDVLGIAKTGSGKTASYVLPLLANLRGAAMMSRNRHVNALVMVPTRELAMQVDHVFKQFTQNLPYRLKSLAVYGGVSINPQMQALQGVQILTATPGRLLELVESNAVHLSDIDTLVLDEADKMLNLGFKDEMDRIFKLLPKRRQNLLFSATLNEGVEAINRVLLRDPVVVKIADEAEHINQIHQTGYFVPEEQKGPLLRYLIRSNDLTQVLVFTASTRKADNVAEKLQKNGINARAVHSKKSQQARTQALADLRLALFAC